MLNHILIAFGVLAVYLAVVLASPTRRCSRCRGKRVTRHRLTRKFIKCPRCKGTSRHYRRGATVVHRFTWSLIDAICDRHPED